VVVASAPYRILQEQANQFKADVDEYKTRWTAVRDELDNLKTNQRAMHEEAIVCVVVWIGAEMLICSIRANLRQRSKNCRATFKSGKPIA
jgi:hypothetical protein